MAAVAVAAVSVGSVALFNYADVAGDLTHMQYLKAIKLPVVRLADRRAPEEFFRDAGRLKGQLEPLKAR